VIKIRKKSKARKNSEAVSGHKKGKLYGRKKRKAMGNG
jgi:hypothetical protein